jgi:dephospho-CoA kinase
MILVIGLSGRIGSGKGTIGEYLAREYGAEGRRFSDILVDLLKRLHISPERKALQNMGATLRSQFGDDVLVKALKKDLEAADSNIVMVDGVRYQNEVEMLRGFEKSILFFVDATPEIRFERVRKRGEKGEGEIDYEEFLRAEKRETERYLDQIKALADFRLDNSGSFDDLYKQIDQALKEHGL